MSLFHFVHLDYLEFQPACIIAHRVIIICLNRYLCLSSFGLFGYYITLHHHLRLSFFTMITLLILPLTKLSPHSSNLSRLYHWFFSSNDLALVSLMLTTSSYLFLLFSPGISSPILVLSPLLLFSMCTHSTSGLLLILVITLSSLTWLRHITFTSLLCLKLGFMQTTRQLKYLMLFFIVSLLLAIFVLFLLHLLFLLLVVAQHPCTLLSLPTTIFKSFEMSTITLKLAHSKLTVYNIYRPPSSSEKSRATASSVP